MFTSGVVPPGDLRTGSHGYLHRRNVRRKPEVGELRRMKKLLNTLYITRQESYVHKERETIVVKNGDDRLGQFPALAISNIFCFGQISVSPFLMHYCGERGIGLSFFSEHG